MPMPASKRKIPNCHTFSANAAAPVKRAYTSTEAANTRTRPKRSAMGPQINERPQPTRKIANMTEPTKPTLLGVPAIPDFGNNSVRAGLRTRA
jgi:hypothetical protein